MQSFNSLTWRLTGNVGALIFRIGFWGLLINIPPNPSSNQLLRLLYSLVIIVYKSPGMGSDHSYPTSSPTLHGLSAPLPAAGGFSAQLISWGLDWGLPMGSMVAFWDYLTEF